MMPQLVAQIRDLAGNVTMLRAVVDGRRGPAHAVFYNQVIPTYKRASLIYNPVAGKLKRGAGHAIRHALDALRDAGIAAEPVPTTGPHTAAAIAREQIARGADLILAAGGDGTINEVANGVAGSAVPLAILPAGTANVLAHELRIGGSMHRVARSLASYVPLRISLGLLRTAADPDGRYFLCMCGVGFDAGIVYRVKAGVKKALGELAYWIAATSQGIRRLPEFDVDLCGGEHRQASFAVACRVRNYGGRLEIAPNIKLMESDFEVVLFRGKSTLPYARYLLMVALGRHKDLAGIDITRAKRVAFQYPEDTRVYVQVDGEYAGRLPASVEIVPDALTLLAPPSFAERRYSDPRWRA